MAIKVAKIEGKGMGLRAEEAIKRGTVICVSPVIFVPTGSLNGTPLENHCWTEGDEDCLTLGPQTLCNHSDEPNCVSILYDELDLLISIKGISEGDELTLCYFDLGNTP